MPNRNPEETRMEMVIKGPRDNFIEDVSVNIALIRKRLPTNSLCVEKFVLGERSKTSVAILYFDDIANKEILSEIKKELNKVDTDIVFSGDLLMEHIIKSGMLFPRTDYTGRPDHAIQSLVRGRFLILVEGVAYVVITPVNLFLLLKSGEDNENTIIFSSFERILRVFSILIGLLLPAFWLALTTFHQNQMPLQLLATIVQLNTGLPLPSAIEMLLMLLMFELFREAGLRLPSAIGGTISVVGGLIIGDAAIRAGVTSPAMIVIIAISTIATFTLINQSLVTAVSVLRICFIVATAFFGLFGFFMSLYFTLFYLTNIRTFGVPYMNISSDLNWSTIKKSLFRLSPKNYSKRPNMLDPLDKTRTKEKKMNKRIWIIVLLLSTFLSGCWDVDEPERMLYVHGVGVDFKDGEYEVYTQIIDFSNTAKTEQPTNNPVQSEVGYAKGKTIDEAIFKLYHSIDQKVFWGFFTFIIFSEEALKDGRANPIIDNFLRYRETRYQIWMYGTNDPIKDLLLTTPIINKSLILSKLGDPENSYEQESFIKPINFRELIIGLNEPNHEMAIPFISVNKHWETEQNETNTISLSGVGLLSPKEFKGYLPADKIRGLQWMTKETKRGEVTVQLDSNDSVEFTVVVDKLKLKVKPIVRKNDVKFDIAIKMNVTVSEFHGDLSSNEIRREVIKEVEKEIRGTYEEALNHNTDIYRLSEYLYRKEFKAWKKLQKDGKVELTEHSIQNIKVEIRKLKSQRKSSKETIEK